MNKQIKFILIFSSLLFIFIIFFFGLNKSNIYTPNKVINIEIPNFESRELFSNQKINAYELIQNSDYSLINIWASWCLPCRDEHPILINLQDKNKLNLIGINYKDKKENSIKFLNELGNPYDTIIIDKNGLISVSLGAYGVPETYLVNRNYKILKRYVGPLNQENVSELFEIINENL